jgi:hypothetical protein
MAKRKKIERNLVGGKKKYIKKELTIGKRKGEK